MSPCTSIGAAPTRGPVTRSGTTVAILIVTLALSSPAFADRAVEPTETPPVVTVRGASGNPWAFVYDVASQRLGCYESRPQGLERRGVRRITWDRRLPGTAAIIARGPSVADVRNHVEQSGSTEGKAPPAAGGLTLATSRSPSLDPLVLVHDRNSRHLLRYTVGRRGIELRAVRDITGDLQEAEIAAPAGD